MRVVIVGGGIVGLASAYYLARRGATVVLCEKGRLGDGSTERSVGGIRAQFAHPTNIELSQSSLGVWEDFDATFGIDIEFRQAGYLFLAQSEQTAADLRESVDRQQAANVPSRIVDPETAREYNPALHADRYTAASYSPGDGFADPHLALQGYSDAATGAGVDIRTRTPVTAIHTDGDGVTGVTAANERITADFVVNAAGPWARRIAAMAGITIPVSPRRRQVLVVEPTSPVPEDHPLTIDLDTGAYFRPERDGTALVGGHFAAEDPDADPDGYSQSFDLVWAATALRKAADCAGYFDEDSGIKRGWAGLYAVTPDDRAILEESIPGFIQAVGFSGHGFQHAPATGRLVAELVMDGAASLVDIGPLRSDRFQEGSSAGEWQVA